MFTRPSAARMRRSAKGSFLPSGRVFSRRRHIASAMLAAMVSIAVRPAAAQDAAVCSHSPLLDAAGAPGLLDSPCTLAAGSLLMDGLYYQNASKVGGTALAAFPLLQIDAGIGHQIDVVFDPPAQIAESGLRGAGLYPRSHSSYGARYRLAQTHRLVLAAGFFVAPLASFYAPSELQPRYAFNVGSAYRLTPALTIRGIASVSNAQAARNARTLPTQALGADVTLSPTTIVSPDLGVRSVAWRVEPQTFGDVSVKRLLSRRFVMNAGLGTAFNPADHVKAHYLAVGLSMQP